MSVLDLESNFFHGGPTNQQAISSPPQRSEEGPRGRSVGMQPAGADSGWVNQAKIDADLHGPGPAVAPESLGKTEVTVVDARTGGAKGQKEARFDLIPPDALWELAVVYGKGSKKYADRNWEKGYDWGLSVGALKRHLARWEMGESRDTEWPLTDAHHLAQVAWHALALLAFELRGLGTDNVRLNRSNQ